MPAEAAPWLLGAVTPEAATWFLGGLTVLLFSIDRFNTPSYPLDLDRRKSDGAHRVLAAPRYLTSKAQYLSWMLFYLGTMMLLFVILGLNLPALAPLLQLPKPDPADASATATSILIAALVIAGILPNAPVIRELERGYRGIFHRGALIPRKARDLMNRIEGYEVDFAASPSSLARGLVPAGQKASDSDSIVYRWAKVAHLVAVISEWPAGTPGRSYLSSDESGWNLIQERYEDTKKPVEIYNRGIKELGPDFNRNLSRTLDGLLKGLYRLLACVLLASEATENNRLLRLRSLGFKVVPHRVLTTDGIVLILLGIAAGVLAITVGMAIGLRVFGGTVTGTPIQMTELRHALPYSITTFAFHGSTVLCVLVAKHMLAAPPNARWPAPEKPLRLEERRWAIYAAMGALGFALATGVILIAVLSTHQPFEWWGVMAMSTGAFMAYHLDTHPARAKPVLQVLAQAAGTGIAALVLQLESLMQDPGQAAFLAVQSAMLGGWIGYWVPVRYRAQMYGRRESDGGLDQEAEEGPPKAPAPAPVPAALSEGQHGILRLLEDRRKRYFTLPQLQKELSRPEHHLATDLEELMRRGLLGRIDRELASAWFLKRANGESATEREEPR